jgi:hypothetical protein
VIDSWLLFPPPPPLPLFFFVALFFTRRRELEAVQRGEDHIIEEAPRQNAQLEDLRTELEHEREAMMLFEREGEDTRLTMFFVV